MADDPRLRALRCALVQQASGLDPAENRAALDERRRRCAGDADLVVLPEAFARDFGEPGSDLAAFAEPLDGPFVDRGCARSPTETTWHDRGWPACSRRPTTRRRPFNTLVLRGGGGLAAYRKIHLYDSFGYRESDRLSRRAARAGRGRRRAASRSG